MAFDTDQSSSRLLNTAVDEFARLPGVGRKTALRLVLHLLRRDEQEVRRFTDAITEVKTRVCYCRQCHNISDTELCPICSDKRRDTSLICVVENIQDVMALERAGCHRGLYHVLGGVISPVDGIGPADIEVDSLVSRVAKGGVNEVIFALNPTMEGDTTSFYIKRKLAPYAVRTTAIARGISVGDEVEYTDEQTLSRSMAERREL